MGNVLYKIDFNVQICLSRLFVYYSGLADLHIHNYGVQHTKTGFSIPNLDNWGLAGI